MKCTIQSLILDFIVVFCILLDDALGNRWQGDSVRWSTNCDFPGNDMGNQTIAGHLCGEICQYTLAECTHFTFTLFQGGTCWFKSGFVSPSQAIPFASAGAVCAYLTISWVHEIDLSWSHNCNFPGGDFENQLTSGERCGPICMGNPHCTHFVWTNVEGQGGICWMKSGGTSREKAIITPGSRGTVCGLRNQNGPMAIVTTSAPWSDTDTCECLC